MGAAARSGDAMPATQWFAPIAPWRGSLLDRVLGGVRSNPAIRCLSDAAAAASRPLIRPEQRGKRQALAVWPEGWVEDGIRMRPPSPKEKQQPHTPPLKSRSLVLEPAGWEGVGSF